ncbi:hypothetical protein K32_04670 [Kaistia sp. 32K]|nr:hypothetical protein K32_04670 [Kaistia sp. 32K]
MTGLLAAAAAAPLATIAAGEAEAQSWGGPGSGPNGRPPQPRMERRPPPRRGYVWVPGHWQWSRGRYVWVSGGWERSRPGWRHRDPQWVWRNGRWVFIQGGWYR